MLLLQCCGLPSVALPQSQSLSLSDNPIKRQNLVLFTHVRTRQLKASTFKLTCQSFGLENVAEVTHNKVLIAATVASAIAQLSKPFTNSILYGKDFDFKAALQSGGFPSCHSSAVAATATALGLERGFSDSIFALSVVYAALVMYDSQGVRREVGIHAKVINRILSQNQLNSIHPRSKDNPVDSKPCTSSLGSLRSKKTNSSASITLTPDETTRLTAQTLESPGLSVNVDEEEERVAKNFMPLKESVGHTEIEVIAGALLGFFISLAVYTVMELN